MQHVRVLNELPDRTVSRVIGALHGGSQFAFLPVNKPIHPFKPMKLKITLLAILAGLVVTSPNASAQENRRERGGFGRQLPPELLKKYDADGDGKLNEAEMKTWREAREKENLEKYDADKDGKLNDEERKKMESENPRRGGFQPDAETLKKFDKDGDGKLSDEERTAWREAREKETLAKYDADKDGKLNDEERKKMESENPRRGGGFPPPDAETLKKFDKDGDGKLSDEERTAQREARQKEMLEKYDADKDGKLSEEEGRKAREDYRKQRETSQTPRAEEKKPEAKPEAKPEEKKAE